MLFLCFSLKAQDDAFIPSTMNPILPQPSSSVFQKYLGYKPDLSTGDIDVKIPLYTLKIQDFSIPLTLIYRTSGIKVNDISYPLGYGWTMMPGLRITRTIMGRADENSILDIRSDNSDDFSYWKNLVSNNYTQRLDSGHDLFTIHLPNCNNPFLIEKVNGIWKAITVDSRLKISLTINNESITEFNIVDENGITYKFGNQYKEIDYRSGEVTAWMLYQVIFPGINNPINFTWQSYNPTRDMEQVIQDMYVIHDYCYSPNDQVSYYNTYLAEEDYESVTQNAYFLSNIASSQENISFKYFTFWGYSGYRPYLQEMQIKNSNNTKIKECKFEYQEACLLSKVLISDEGDYNFEYDSCRITSVKSQDYWGYNNSADNSTLVPSFSVYTMDKSFRLVSFEGANRDINAEAMQANILKKIIYPTKGYIKFEYEPHQFYSYTSDISEGGGLRVKKTISSSGPNAPDIIRSYKYGKNENGKGYTTITPTLDTFFQERFCLYDEDLDNKCEYRQLLIKGESSCTTIPTFNVPVWYDYVSEYEGENKTTYLFTNSDNSISVMRSSLDHRFSVNYPTTYVCAYNNFFQNNPVIQKLILYKKESESYLPIKRIEYDYKELCSGHAPIYGLVAERHLYHINGSDGDFYDHETFGTADIFLKGSYTINPYIYKPCTERTVLYSGNDSICSKKDINYKYYDNDRYSNVSSVVTTGSNGSVYTDNIYYTSDTLANQTPSQEQAVSSMRSLNRITAPIKFSRYIGSDLIFQKNIQYRAFGTNLIYPEKEIYKTKDFPEETRVTYDKYDDYGNIQGITKDKLPTTYLWGYKKQYVVAKIEGITYLQVENALGNAFITNLATTQEPSESQLQSIRNAFANNTALVTTYTYKPLIGMISKTDPRGITTTYTYDNDSGRLLYIKDHDGNILENYIYHFKELN
jgi:hypothetical protein